jgi:hypothetical protein
LAVYHQSDEDDDDEDNWIYPNSEDEIIRSEGMDPEPVDGWQANKHDRTDLQDVSIGPVYVNLYRCVLNQLIGQNDLRTRIYMNYIERYMWIPAEWTQSQHRIVQKFRHKPVGYHVGMMITIHHRIQKGEGQHIPTRFLDFLKLCQAAASHS